MNENSVSVVEEEVPDILEAMLLMQNNLNELFQSIYDYYSFNL